MRIQANSDQKHWEKLLITWLESKLQIFILEILTQTAGNSEVCIVLALRLQKFI